MVTNDWCIILSSHVLDSSGPEIIKLFSCSTQLSMKFSLLLNMKMPPKVRIFIFISREIVFISREIVGIFKFISRGFLCLAMFRKKMQFLVI